MAADTTPDRELVHGDATGAMLAREDLGPSYRGAFGVIAFVHLLEADEHGKVMLEDQGIRTHATGNLASLADAASHGCHRLLGEYAIRLADFILAHHGYSVRGDARTSYRRVVHYGGTFRIAIDSLGYEIELTPPIDVDVLDRGRW